MAALLKYFIFHGFSQGCNFKCLKLILSRSLILCHSKTNDDCPEERHAGKVSDGCRTWGPGWTTDVTAGDQTRYRDTDSKHWRTSQQSTLEKRGGSEADHPVHHTTTLRESKRSVRRSFSIKVRLHKTDPWHKEMIEAKSLTNVHLSGHSLVTVGALLWGWQKQWISWSTTFVQPEILQKNVLQPCTYTHGPHQPNSVDCGDPSLR